MQNPFATTTIDEVPRIYTPDRAAFNIGNAYGGTLEDAIAGAQGRTTPMAGAAYGAGAIINGRDSAEARRGQMGLVQALQARAAGRGGPSVAEMQMNRGLGTAIAAQRSQAASARGVNPGMAQRLASQGIASSTARTNIDAGMLRAQEQMAAEGSLAQALAGVRGQDIGQATAQAQLTQGANLANAGFQQQTGLANQGAELQNRAQMDAAIAQFLSMGMSREEAETAARIKYEELFVQSSTNQANLQQQTAMANQQAQTQQNAATLGLLGGTAQGGMIAAGGGGG